MDVYILNLIFMNQKNEEGVFLKNLYPVVAQDNFSKIKSKTGLHTAVKRLERKKLIEIIKLKKTPPENLIKITKKGLSELKLFSKKFQKKS